MRSRARHRSNTSVRFGVLVSTPNRTSFLLDYMLDQPGRMKMNSDLHYLAERAMHDEDAAYQYLEKFRWPDSPFCPHCGLLGKVYRLAAAKGKRQVLKCAACRRHFNVTIGTIFEHTHIPLSKWMMA